MSEGRRRLSVLDSRGGPGDAPAFARVAIAGLGTVGASLALALRRAWPSTLVIGCDRNDRLEAAVSRGVIEVGADDLVIAGGADFVVLAGLPDRNAAALARLADLIQGRAVVMDLGGDEGTLGAAAATLPERLALISGALVPPLLEEGLEAASWRLFEGRAWRLAGLRADARAWDCVERAVRATGGIPVRGQPGRPADPGSGGSSLGGRLSS
ncbi:MAG TPA: prephenate dehydrogenase/arogenate dehydrogenase family protein [Vicinamibacterales bacterium]|nr:prephenate dehydrogenase/arogenate dehydrogenase family protein [Vicinamibacterales bacterium]HOQ61953.1 prephenate dehydrogenase/arogenate dehydrogenase family protein [Vicinamibacterales bacterium]